MDDNDSFGFTVLDLVELSDLTFVDDISGIGTIWIHAGEHIHQCGFPGSVLPAQRMDLAFFHLQIYIVQCLHA